jgi:hypothetical protein
MNLNKLQQIFIILNDIDDLLFDELGEERYMEQNISEAFEQITNAIETTITKNKEQMDSDESAMTFSIDKMLYNSLNKQ